MRRCGNGVVEGPEGCDDSNTLNGDGCSSTCQVENGYWCFGSPSACSKAAIYCGNGLPNLGEQCDDRNTVNGDGCSSVCQVESSYTCTDATAAAASICTKRPPINKCGNGLPDAGEQCDDKNNNNLDGCSSNCLTEPGYTCTAASFNTPSVCNRVPLNKCGNGLSDPTEQCDDKNNNNGDGCSSTCQTEPGYTCTTAQPNYPSICTRIPVPPVIKCGNGLPDAGEQCDDKNNNNGDGCSSNC